MALHKQRPGGRLEQQKSKARGNIEVADQASGSTAKIACMSCIRGHRTTSCGIANCRNKVFWTVKRPGRPANSCTCTRSGGTCVCVIAQGPCPHKTKKGEKRSGECRCDEGGRYCCTISEVQWEELSHGQRPSVRFFKTAEALHNEQYSIRHDAGTGGDNVLDTENETQDAPSCCEQDNSCCSKSATQQPTWSQRESVPIAPAVPYKVPRFGLMGTGAPQGSGGQIAPDVMGHWDSSPTPIAPRTHSQSASPMPGPSHQQQQPPRLHSCCDSSNRVQLQQYHPELSSPTFALSDHFDDVQPTGLGMAIPDPTVETNNTLANLSNFINQFQSYQFPGAMCQQCGRRGCSCSRCPPVMQSFNNANWGACGRGHERDSVYMPPSQQYPQSLPIQTPTSPFAEPQSLPATSPHAEHTPSQQHQLPVHTLTSQPRAIAMLQRPISPGTVPQQRQFLQHLDPHQQMPLIQAALQQDAPFSLESALQQSQTQSLYDLQSPTLGLSTEMNTILPQLQPHFAHEDPPLPQMDLDQSNSLITEFLQTYQMPKRKGSFDIDDFFDPG